MNKTILFGSTLVIMLTACNGEYTKQLDLAKKDKCELFAKYEQLKTDSANAQLRSEINQLEKMLDMRAELSESQEKFNEELKAFSCN